MNRPAAATMTREKYDRAVEIYLLGTRSHLGLAKALGVAKNTADRLINRGYPAHKWPALKDRAKIYDQEQEERLARASKPTPQQVDEMGRWVEMRETNMKVQRSLRGLAADAANRIGAALAIATAKRYVTTSRVVEIEQGKKKRQVVVKELHELPPYLPHLVQSVRALETAMASAGSTEAFWAKITVPDHLKGASTGWDHLKAEELQHIIDNGGRLPPGVTIEMLRRRA